MIKHYRSFKIIDSAKETSLYGNCLSLVKKNV